MQPSARLPSLFVSQSFAHRALRFAAAALVLGSVVVGAAPAARAADDDVARLSGAGHSLKWNWNPPGSADRYGHAEVLINAPIASVRTQVLSFGSYKEFVPDKFHNARVVGKQDGSTDVYMQVPIMRGLLNLWAVTRFSPLRVLADGEEQMEGNLIKGNVKAMRIIWTLKPVDDRFTVLKMDLLLLPPVAAPQAMIDEELRDAAQQTVDAIHDRAQGHKRTVAYSALAATTQTK